MNRTLPAREAGETLAEVLVAVAILGIAVAALLGGIGASATGSDVHRKQATAETVLRGYAEAIEAASFDGSGCNNAATSYQASALGFASPSGYAPSKPVVVAQSPDAGACASLQLVTIKVVTTRTTLTVSLVKAAP